MHRGESGPCGCKGEFQVKLETTSPSLPTQVIFWCLNEESDFEVAYNLGATGVMTDYPTALRRYLDNRGAQ